MTRLLSIPRGDDVIEALRAATAGIDAWVQASGVVEGVELRVAGDGVDPTRSLRGRLTLVSLAGPAGGPYGVTLARATDVALEVLAGELVRARSDGVTVLVVPVSQAPAALADLSKLERSSPRASPGPLKPPSAWASQALASAANAHSDEAPEPERLMPLPGDLVQHFAFGLCEVLMGDDERLKIRDVQGPGRIREILLDMLEIRVPTEKDGKRLFRLDRRT